KLSCSMIRYLWNATVRGVMLRIAATCFIECPSAISWITSRCRAVRSCDVPCAGGLRMDPTSPSVTSDVTYDSRFMRSRKVEEGRRREPFQQVSRRARAERFRREIRILVHRQEDDPRGRQQPFQLPRRVDAVQERHRDVDDDDVGPQFDRGRHQRAAVRHRADDVALVGEQLLERLEQQRVIVGEQDAWAAHAVCFCFSPRGGWSWTRTPMRVPWPGDVWTAMSPPSDRTRSRMHLRPRPPNWRRASKPCPGSAMRSVTPSLSPISWRSASMTPLCLTMLCSAS